MLNKYKSKGLHGALALASSEQEAKKLCGCDVELVERDCGVKIAIDWGEEPKWWDLVGKRRLKNSKARYELMRRKYGVRD